MSLFNAQEQSSTLPPLAERLRPKSLDEFLGQQHILGPRKLLQQALQSQQLFSMILWGPPGSGKTTLAKILARTTGLVFFEVSAVTAGVKDIREIISRGKANLELGRKTMLFIDEIHRFNKAQQDALLHAAEDGSILLVGATTENPTFEVITPLLSRCRVLKLQPLGEKELSAILDRALTDDLFLSTLKIEFLEKSRGFLIEAAGGDARKLLNTLELSVNLVRGKSKTVKIKPEHIREALQNRAAIYDKTGEYHYDTISAFIKSVRGSDPDAALYWLAVMLEGGEDPLFIARRLIILASEDIGNADPQGLTLATAGFQAVHNIGMPEASLVLAQVTTYLASTTKSNASYLGINAARKAVQENSALPVPLHLRNAPTKLMAAEGYAKGYRYPHDEPGHFSAQDYLPEKLRGAQFYQPSQQGLEQRIYQRLSKLWPKRFPSESRSTGPEDDATSKGNQ
ncbi:MAG: replication-associated recombination protein A [Candidatus Marinimicrobia bacterium]|nr:replication-associated recombination protein A [Candidatus Neomarinimicrobiota bacterium]